MDVKNIVSKVEDSSWVLAIAIIIGNLGMSYILDDLNEKKKDVLNNCFLRKVYLFALIYCGTKDLIVSLTATLFYAMIVHMI